MKAVIMAGGEGSRLRPQTCNEPKPMMKFFGKPVMEHIIELLKKHGITEIAVTLQYMPKVITDYFGDGADFGVKLEYFTEKSPLGTAGSVKETENFLSDEFLVISGDAVTDIDLSSAINFHHSKGAEATLVLSKVENPLEYGIVVTDDSGKIERFMEKPSPTEVFTNTANTGIYILNKSVLQSFDKGVKTDFSGDVFPKLLAEGRALYGVVDSGYWCDIGDNESYIKAHKDRLRHFVSPSANIVTTARIEEPCWIGENVYIGENAYIGAGSVIENRVWIGENVSIKGSIIGENTYLNNNVSLRNCIVGENVDMGDYVAVFEGAVIGANSKIGKFSEVLADSKIWANKEVAEGSLVKGNIVFGNNYSSVLFGERAIDGEVNVDITPEFASKLGAAFGAMQKGKVGVGYGSNPALIMLKNAFISGAISSGCDVLDLSPTLLPITRNATVFYGLQGSVYLTEKGGRFYAHVLDENGLDITPKQERALEQLFARDDFRRVEIGKIGKITEIKDYNSFYIHQIKGNVAMDIALQSSEPVAEEVAKTVMGNMGAIVGNSGVRFVLDSSGEIVDIYDENGKRVSEYNKLYLILEMLARSEEKIVLPLNSPMVLKNRARELGIGVINSKMGDTDILHALHKHSLQYQYGLMFDGTFLISQICQYLSEKKAKLADILEEIPPAYVASRDVDVPDYRKGEIIQELWKREANADITQGVKIDKGNKWVMVVPHKIHSKVSVMAEGENMEVAEDLCSEYEKLVVRN